MWIFTTIGFFSVVQKHGEDFLTVRARAASDLDRLRTQYLSDLLPTIVTKSADYHYRATISHGSFSRGMAAMCQNIHYDNFKNKVAKCMGYKREHVYEKVWTVVQELEKQELE
jgi:hypothetical protein